MTSYCMNCGREIEESWTACPDCGKILKETRVPQAQPTIQPSPRPYQVQPYQRAFRAGEGSGFGVVSLICGIIGLLGTLAYGPVLGNLPVLRFLAVIFGSIGIKRDDNTSMAVIGLILGIIGLALFAVSYIFGRYFWERLW